MPDTEIHRATASLPADIMAWRKRERLRLIDERLAVDDDERRRRTVAIASRLDAVIGALSGQVIGFYWPFRGEPDLRSWVRILAERGGHSALPVVVEKKAPLVFRTWRPGDRLVPGIYNIPVPADGVEVIPHVVIAPVVGFDRANYRLGYGSGYFDRTLAALSPRPLIIGVGYEHAAIATIHPLPHDIPMDIIATESRTVRREDKPDD